MNIYLAGPMRGIPDFNFPAFMQAAKGLRNQGHNVFNPAERDIERAIEEGKPQVWQNETGDIAQAEASGNFDRRVAIMDDLTYIIQEADAIALLPGWEASKGANAEMWTAKFLDLEVIELAA